eukprot:3064552-Amphidinium_carterae.1
MAHRQPLLPAVRKSDIFWRDTKFEGAFILPGPSEMSLAPGFSAIFLNWLRVMPELFQNSATALCNER